VKSIQSAIEQSLKKFNYGFKFGQAASEIKQQNINWTLNGQVLNGNCKLAHRTWKCTFQPIENIFY